MPINPLRLLKGLALALLCYALIGFLILPGVAQHIANQQLATHALVPAHVQRLEFNPFSLELRVHGLQIGEDAEPQVAFQRLAANLQIDSLWGEALHLSELALDGLRLEVLFGSDGTLNLTQLFRTSETPKEEAPEADSQPFPLQLDRLQLADGHLRFRDQRGEEPVEFVAEALNFQLENLSTLPERNATMRLTGTTPDGGSLSWQGDVTLQPLHSSGQLELAGVQLRPWWPYVRPHLPMVLNSGRLDLKGQYRLDLAEQTQLQVEQAMLRLEELALDSGKGPRAELQRLEIDQLALDLAARELSIGRLASSGLKTAAVRNADGSLDWQRLLESAPARQRATKPAESTTEAAAAESAPAAQDEAPAAPWRIRLAQGELADYRLSLTDRSSGEEVKLDVGPLSLQVRQFDSAAEQPFEVDLNTGLGPHGRLATSGPVSLAPLGADLKVEASDLDLRPLQAYLRPYVRLELHSGLLSSQLQIAFQQQEQLKLEVEGSAQVTQLHTQDSLRKRDFVKWPRLALDGIAYQHPDRLAIRDVVLEQPYARFVINENRTTNVSELIVPQPASTQPAPAPSDPQKPLRIQIGGIRIIEGSGHFADFSLMPPFATALQELNGQIGTLDNQGQQPAKVKVTGKVDRYAPVNIEGELKPFDPLERLDIATQFRNVELTTLTPYSGKFAGYRIRKGRLNLALHYRIHQGQLQADNKVVLEQLQLGEKVESPDAVDLPVRLAVALLKDSRGVIDIELPVSGDLNDPQFSVMPIIWQTLRNLVVRAVQAPFKMLGNLAGAGDQDLSQVLFTGGSSTLDETAQNNLQTLAKALSERPSLRLEVEGGASFAADGASFGRARLEREYQSTLYSILQRRGEKVPANADQLQVPDSDRPALLEGIYRSRLAQQPPAEWRELDDDERHQRMEQALIEHWSNNEALARRLAQQRAARIKEFLVEQAGLDASRVYLIDVSVVEAEADGRTATTLHLGSD